MSVGLSVRVRVRVRMMLCEGEGEGEGEGKVRVSHSEGEEGDFRSNHFSAPWMAMPTSDTVLRAAPATWSSRWPATALPP